MKQQKTGALVIDRHAALGKLSARVNSDRGPRIVDLRNGEGIFYRDSLICLMEGI